MKSASVTVSDTAALLAVAGSGGQAEITVSVPDSTTVYVGGEDVTTETGLILIGPLTQPFRVGPKEAIYVVGTTGAVTVSISQLGFE